MDLTDLLVLAAYLQAFVWYGRLSYVQGVLDRHFEPDCGRVRHVLAGRRVAGRPARPASSP